MGTYLVAVEGDRSGPCHARLRSNAGLIGWARHLHNNTFYHSVFFIQLFYANLVVVIACLLDLDNRHSRNETTRSRDQTRHTLPATAAFAALVLGPASQFRGPLRTETASCWNQA